MTTPQEPLPEKADNAPKQSAARRHVKKLVSGMSALVVLAVGALFTGIGEGAVNRLMELVSPQESATAAPTQSPSAAPSVAPKEALTFAVRTDVGAAPDSLALRGKEVEGPVGEALKSGKLDPWDTFLPQHDGAPVTNVVISMVVTGHRDTAIRIVNIEVQKFNTEPVLDGTLLNIQSQGNADPIKLSLNIDEARPRIMSGSAPYFPGTHLEVKSGEQESLTVDVTATALKFYRWVFAVEYVDENGALQRVYLNRAGKTFAASSDIPLTEAFMLTGRAPAYGTVWTSNIGEPGFTLGNV